jgi:hypothetical protein
MTDRTQLIEDLRIRLLDGATPSRLIQQILVAMGDAISYAELCDLLQRAFQLPVARISPSSLGPQHDHRGVVLNKTILPEIVQRRAEWDAARPHGYAVEQSWMDGLSLPTPEAIGNEVRAAPIPGLSLASWGVLTPEEQDILHGNLTSALVFSQRIEVLSRLVERLQEKICELETSTIPSIPLGRVLCEKDD